MTLPSGPSTLKTTSRSGRSARTGASRATPAALWTSPRAPESGQPPSQSIDPEQNRERKRHRAELVECDMGNRHVARLGQQEAHPVAAPDPGPAQGMGEAIGRLPEAAETT